MFLFNNISLSISLLIICKSFGKDKSKVVTVQTSVFPPFCSIIFATNCVNARSESFLEKIGYSKIKKLTIKLAKLDKDIKLGYVDEIIGIETFMLNLFQ